MAKNKEQKPEEGAAGDVELVVVESERVEIVLKQDRQVGDTQRKAGDKLATVLLEPDVSLGYLVRAVHDDVAGILAAAQ